MEASSVGLVSVDPRVLALLLSKAAQTETLRRRRQRLSVLMADGRLKPGDKVLAAAVWDMAPLPPADGTPLAPVPVHRAALARSTGLGVSTISRKLQDLATMGLIGREIRQVGPEESELWVAPGVLPPATLTAAELDALATKRGEDRARKCCPACQGEHLQVASYVCLDCGETCAAEDAREAGRHTVIMTPGGVVVDEETGEVLERYDPRAESAHHSTPGRGRADSARGQQLPRPTGAGRPRHP